MIQAPSHSFLILIGLMGAMGPLAEADEPIPLPPVLMRPRSDAGPTPVGYAIWIADIPRIDSVAQTFDANFYALFSWQDPRLSHAGPGAKQYALEDIWHPRYIIENATQGLEKSLPEVADVSPDGTAVYRQRFVGSFSESLDLRAFPFDSDTFRVQFIFPGLRPEDIRFTPDATATAAGIVDGAQLAVGVTVQDWKVGPVVLEDVPYHISPTLELASLKAEFKAQRNSNHFVIKVIFPLILIVAMSWAVFWVEPHDASTQMGVAVTVMLTLIAYRFSVDADVPELPYLTRLDDFVLMSSLVVFLSLIEVMVTTKLAHRDRTRQARIIDRWCRWIFPACFFAGTLATLCG
jgi:Neurotransmitter-gated ion-channel ligand binding domain/Neurotransmitter-gated ion-channel transmembrane region